MGENLMVTRKFNTEHRAGQNRRNFTLNLYRFFFIIRILGLFRSKGSFAATTARTASSVVSWRHNESSERLK